MHKCHETGDDWLEQDLQPDAEAADFYDSPLYKSPDPGAVSLHKLDRPALSPPECPGDNSFDPALGLGLPDTFGKNFHPNENGHVTMASFALVNLVYVRQKKDRKSKDMYQVDEEFTCWQKSEGRKALVSWERLDKNYRYFCDSVTNKDGVNWKFVKTYHKGMPEKARLVIQLSNGASEFNKECLSSFDKIINSCDGNDPKNPLNFKLGGRHKIGS